ncbi:NADPH:quinone oxidoreductase family protein [Alteromonas gilva]|uniref:NADPH:quinone oxidoreductase family protein n=1 Tax=Alteromonas gilva TaxID=2987522 RepID=A0ABT5KZE9_9ALTE|nr:NADPH:quinone oxidoreductase family protein [Alteromonas gilva]MDC8830149.1 NADPH:quinone oxidoreductase family protein [Alteromonas gilva]
MKAIVCHDFAPLEQLAFEDWPTPDTGADEALVNVAAIGVNFPDALLVQGLYQAKPERPFVPGAEFSGVVEAVGENVTHLKKGDRVVGLSTHYSACAEQISVPAARLIPVPDHIPMQEAAGLILAHGTAHYALKQRANLQPGETLLVLGAAGGTGLAAVQIGKAMGATVIAGCSTDEKLNLAKENGADVLINYNSDDLHTQLRELTKGKGVDVVYDPIGGELFNVCSRNMAPAGRLLVVGFAGGDIPKFPVNLALVKEYAVVGVFFGAFTRRDPAAYADNMRELLAWYKDGKVQVHIDATYPLAQTAEAFAAVMHRKARGKLIITP